MKKILCFVAALAATTFITTTSTSCKFAPDQHDGDTVAASEFYPEDTTADPRQEDGEDGGYQGRQG